MGSEFWKDILLMAKCLQTWAINKTIKQAIAKVVIEAAKAAVLVTNGEAEGKAYTISRIVHQRPSGTEQASLRPPVFNWNAKDKNLKLQNFRMG